MSKTEIMNKLTRAWGKAELTLKKHSPEILMVGGVIIGVAATVSACKATLKVHEVLDEAKENIDAVHNCLEDPEMSEKYTQEDGKKDLAIIYAQTGLKFAKLYGPAILLGATSVGCIFASNNIIRKRNIALAAAYATVDKGFKEYRGRVVERFGKELDRELRYNIKSKEIQEVTVDENGEEKVETKTVEVCDVKTAKYGKYAVIFDEYCKGWRKDAEMNKYYLLQQQNFANEKLQAQGYLFLNNVYDLLGIDRTKEGQVVGWIYDPHDPLRQNYIDFGIFDIHNESARDFVNGRERSIILDLDPDGIVEDRERGIILDLDPDGVVMEMMK